MALWQCGANRIRTAVFLAAAVLLLLWPLGMRARAAESAAQEPAAETGGEAPAAETVMIRLEAQREETDRAALLDRINEIRKEACEEGVDSPVDGSPLTPADYVPLTWSGELEEIALQRAAESMILQDHIRPDGRDCFTAAPEGVSFTTETLAWGFESAREALEGWYSEKASYLNADGKPAGHYMALINPQSRCVGIAGLGAPYQRRACAGAFGKEAAAGETAIQKEKSPEEDRMIPVRRDLLPAVLHRALEVTAGRILRAAVF